MALARASLGPSFNGLIRLSTHSERISKLYMLWANTLSRKIGMIGSGRLYLEIMKAQRHGSRGVLAADSDERASENRYARVCQL